MSTGMSDIRKNGFRGLISVVYQNYVQKDIKVVDEREVYWVPTAEVFSHRKIKRTRDSTKPKGAPEGEKRWDNLYWSMRHDGYDQTKPVIFEN